MVVLLFLLFLFLYHLFFFLLLFLLSCLLELLFCHSLRKAGSAGSIWTLQFFLVYKKFLYLYFICHLYHDDFKFPAQTSSPGLRRLFPSVNLFGASLMAQMVKHLPAMWETRVWSLGQEDILKKEIATHSITLAWKISRMEESGGATVHGVAKSWTQLSDFTFLSLLTCLPKCSASTSDSETCSFFVPSCASQLMALSYASSSHNDSRFYCPLSHAMI